MQSLRIVSINQTHSQQEKIAVQNLQGHGEKHLYQHFVSSCRSFQLLPGAACLCLIGKNIEMVRKTGITNRIFKKNLFVNSCYFLVECELAFMSGNCHVLFQIMYMKYL